MIFLSASTTAFQFATSAIPQIEDYLEILQGDGALGQRKLLLLRNSTELLFDGGISFGAADEVRRILDAAPQVRAIHLNSPGGRIDEAYELRKLIRERKLVTYTSTECASACTIAFTGGSPRYIGKTARLGFHRPYGAGASEREIDALVAEIKESLVKTQVKQSFLDRAYSVPSETMWFPTTEELIEARYVTAVNRGNMFAMSELTSLELKDDLEAFVLQSPVYVAIKDIDRPAYEAILRAWEAGRRNGDSEDDIVGQIRQVVRQLVQTYVPFADDQSALALGELVADQIKALGEQYRDSCYAMVANAWWAVPGAPSSRPKEFVEREEAIAAKIIAQGARSEPFPRPDPAALSAAMSKAIERVKHDIPDAEPVLNTLRSPTVDRDRACQVTEGLYRSALTLPQQEGALVVRHLLSQR